MGRVSLTLAIVLLSVCSILPAGSQTSGGPGFPVLPPSWPADAQSTTGPVPPPSVESQAAPAVMDSQTLISGVPSYMWYRGCGPTAVGMVIGYWDANGFDNLVPGSAATQTSAVSLMISSTGNYNDYCLPLDSYPNLLPDKSEPPAGDEHPDDCVADYMFTSQSAYGNYYGWSWYSDVPAGFVNCVQKVEPAYLPTAKNLYFRSMPWSTFCAEIDAGRPVVFLVDSNGDNATDHFVTAVGYGISGGIQMYACHDTWNSGVRWCEYAGMRSGQSFGIYGGTFFSIVKASDQIAAAKKMADGSSVTLRSVPVTAALPGAFYVEETDRSCGIRVSKSSYALTAGMRADVTGTLQTTSGGERYMSASTAVANGSGAVNPVALANRSVGGTDWNYNPTSGAGQMGVADGTGLNNIGMLVRTGGRVTYSTSGFFYIDDGSGANDGSGHAGIRVAGNGLTSAGLGTYVLVTGVVSCYKGSDGGYHPVITARTQSDIIEIGS